jgi:hypothetical protein
MELRPRYQRPPCDRGWMKVAGVLAAATGFFGFFFSRFDRF